METINQNQLCFKQPNGLKRCGQCFPNYIYKMHHFKLKKGAFTTEPLLRFDVMIVVMKGKIKLSINEKSVVVSEGEMLVFPMFSVINADILEDSEIFCNTFCFEGKHECLARKTQYTKQELMDKATFEYKPLPLTPDIILFIQTILNLLRRYSDCQAMYKIKSHEISMFLSADYSAEELMQLFKPVIRLDPDIYSGLNAGLDNFNTVKDMEEWMDMDSEAFHERFVKSFEQEPDEWLQSTRALLLAQYIKTRNCGLNEVLARFNLISEDHLECILEKYNLPSLSELFAFQKRYMKTEQ